MTTGNTTLLGLALPVEGELDGTWGDTVNQSITELVDSAVAGTTTLSADADVTLTDTTLAANQARQAVLLWTASNGASTRNVTAPARSKPYIVINAGTGSIVLRGAGPTAGVTIISGEKCLAAWNGSDFVKVATSTAATLNGTETLTNKTVEFVDGSAAAPSITNVGDTNTGMFFPAADTIAATVGGTERMRLDSSGNLGLGVTPGGWQGDNKALQVANASFWGSTSLTAFASVGSNYAVNSGGGYGYISSNAAADYYQFNGAHVWRTAPSGTAGNAISFTQAMTLDASGNLGIGTTSPAAKLDVNGRIKGAVVNTFSFSVNTTSGAQNLFQPDSQGQYMLMAHDFDNRTSASIAFCWGADLIYELFDPNSIFTWAISGGFVTVNGGSRTIEVGVIRLR